MEKIEFRIRNRENRRRNNNLLMMLDDNYQDEDGKDANDGSEGNGFRKKSKNEMRKKLTKI